MKLFVFVFKYRFRRSAFNNFLKIKNLNNYRTLDLSGPLKYYLIGIPLLTLNKLLLLKSIVFISCDGRPFLKNNGVNIWFGGTSLKTSELFRNKQNNCYILENFYKKEKNLIQFAPTLINKTLLKKNFEIIYLSEIRINPSEKVKKIWKDNKTKIMKNFLIIEKKDFWKKYKINNFEEIQKDYIQVRNLIRLETVIELKKRFKKRFRIFGNTWKDYVKDVEESNYDRKFIKKLYNGNLCLDFGSKWGSEALYPRSIEIIENGGTLLQAEQKNSKEIFGKNSKELIFSSVIDLKKKISKIERNNGDYFVKFINLNKKKFEKINEKTLKKIRDISLNSL